MALQPCQLMEYQINNIFMDKSCRKCAAKAGPRPLFNFGIISYVLSDQV